MIENKSENVCDTECSTDNGNLQRTDTSLFDNFEKNRNIYQSSKGMLNVTLGIIQNSKSMNLIESFYQFFEKGLSQLIRQNTNLRKDIKGLREVTNALESWNINLVNQINDLKRHDPKKYFYLYIKEKCEKTIYYYCFKNLQNQLDENHILNERPDNKSCAQLENSTEMYKPQYEASQRELQKTIETVGALTNEVNRLNDRVKELANICTNLANKSKQLQKGINSYHTNSEQIYTKICHYNQQYIEEDMLLKIEAKVCEQVLHNIQNIDNAVKTYAKQISEFQGYRCEKTYLHLEEMLKRAILKLDDVDCKSFDVIKERRKEVIIFIQCLMEELNKKAT